MNKWELEYLGNPDQWPIETTPVFRPERDSMRISPMRKRGEAPGWLYRHPAALADHGQSLLVTAGMDAFGEGGGDIENVDAWSLNTKTGGAA